MARKQKKFWTRFRVEVKGGALPAPLCYAAGRLIGSAEARLVHLQYELETGSKPTEIRSSATSVGVDLGLISAEFPRTEKTLRPIQKKFLLKSLKKDSLKKAVAEARRAVLDLKRKAQIGCNVSR
jgi:hypothetical protein